MLKFLNISKIDIIGIIYDKKKV